MLRNVLRKRFASKVFKDGMDAAFDVKDGSSVIFAGFGLPGIAENSIRILIQRKIQNITFISNSTGVPNWSAGLLVRNGQLAKIYASFVGGNPMCEKLYQAGKLAIEYVPQGNLIEKIRNAQAGIPAFFTPTGAGNLVEFGGFPTQCNPDGTPKVVTRPREKRNFDGRDYIMEEPFNADFSFVKAHVGDKYGNLRYRYITRNFNPLIAGAGKITIAEVDHLVDRIPPDKVHTPGVYIDRVYQADFIGRKVERLKVTYEDDFDSAEVSKEALVRNKIAKRVAREFKTGMYVNLGIGIPTLVPVYVSPDLDLNFQVENGLVGSGAFPTIDQIDPDLVNAAKETITLAKGHSISDSAESFGMMRGKHLHVTVLGGLQVSENGDLANWFIPGKKATGMGGAMDLAASLPVIVAMEHTNKGVPRILPRCKYPLTANNCVKKIITELAVFEINEKEGLVYDDLIARLSISENSQVYSWHNTW